jgi:hypothetical protein
MSVAAGTRLRLGGRDGLLGLLGAVLVDLVL